MSTPQLQGTDHPRLPAPPRPRRSAPDAPLLLVLVLATLVLGYHQLTDAPESRVVTSEHDGGNLPEGVTAFDEEHAGVANLDPDLRAALRAATSEAATAGVELHVNSGWRSPAYQQQLLDEAVAEHGSREEAARWVATPRTSPHVLGEAVDVGDRDAATWLAEHGADHGLCRVYDNEPWHFELRPRAFDEGCPPTYADPTEDPRLQG